MGVLTETALQNQIRLAVSAECGDVTLWRNHTGALKSADGRMVQFGLCPGSADLIGIRAVTITPDMVGQTIGQFVAMEIKMPGGRVRPDQVQFLEHVRSKGGLSAVAKSTDEAVALLR
jgi:hypothetical protein